MLVSVLLDYELSYHVAIQSRWPTASPSGTERTSSSAPGYTAPSYVYTLIRNLFHDKQMMRVIHLEAEFCVLV
jgi:hypothetical protein